MGSEPLAREFQSAGDIGCVWVVFGEALGQHQLGLIGALDFIKRVEPDLAGNWTDRPFLRRSDHAVAKLEVNGNHNLAKAGSVLVWVRVLGAHTLIPAAWQSATVTRPALMQSPAALGRMVRAHGLQARISLARSSNTFCGSTDATGFVT